MARKPRAIYAPGELSELRQKLGITEPGEAKRIAELLGGEVGLECVEEEKPKKKPAVHDETVSLGLAGKTGGQKHRIETVEIKEPRHKRRGTTETSYKTGSTKYEVSSRALNIPFRERFKMDRLAARKPYAIKTKAQAFSVFFHFRQIGEDPINPAFTVDLMNQYYAKLENLVKAARSLLPRSNIDRAAAFQKEAPFAYTVIDLIRNWRIDFINKELSRLQAKPKDVVAADFISILKTIYGPLYQLAELDPNDHIAPAFRGLQAYLIKEMPSEKIKIEQTIQNAQNSYGFVSSSLPVLLYPLLMRFVSNRCVSYEVLFRDKLDRIESFLSLSQNDRIKIPTPEVLAQSITNKTVITEETPGIKPEAKSDDQNTQESEASSSGTPKRQVSRALSQALFTMEKIFPKAGWDTLSNFPDLYPYFSSCLDLGRGSELISPTDPMQQIVILIVILEQLFYGLRFISFNETLNEDGGLTRTADIVERITGNWSLYVEDILAKEYFPRLTEYCRLIDANPEIRAAPYAKRLLDELLWLKRLFFLPFLRFQSFGTARPSRKFDFPPLYKELRTLRRALTQVAAGIEAGKRRGGSHIDAACEGIDNPWSPYIFQVANPVSERLGAVLGGKASKRRTNAALIYITLAATSLLDTLINEHDSWAYANPAVIPFRSVDSLGIKPLFGTDMKIDADAIFRQYKRVDSDSDAPEPHRTDKP